MDKYLIELSLFKKINKLLGASVKKIILLIILMTIFTSCTNITDMFDIFEPRRFNEITDGGVITYPEKNRRVTNYSEDEEKPKKNVTPNFTGKRTERNI